jgi:hypothetical protein
MLRLAAALGVLLLAATPAAAEMTLAMETSVGPIKPGAESRVVDAVVTLDCVSLLPRAAMAPAVVTLAFAAPDVVLVTGPNTDRFVVEDCPPGAETATKRIPYAVTIAHGAPGFVDLQVQVEARLESHPADAAGGTPAASAGLVVTAGAELASELALDEKVKGCACPVTFDLAVTNSGNVRTRYTFELDSAPAAGTVVLPEPFEVDPSTAGSTSTGTGRVVYQSPGLSMPGEVAFSVVVHSAAAADPSITGGTLAAHMLVRNVGGSNQASPGLDPLLVVLLLAGLACWAARRRA